MDDQEMVQYIARQCAERYGREAVGVLRGHADHAATIGDPRSAQTWFAIAEAAERLLSGVGD